MYCPHACTGFGDQGFNPQLSRLNALPCCIIGPGERFGKSTNLFHEREKMENDAKQTHGTAQSMYADWFKTAQSMWSPFFSSEPQKTSTADRRSPEDQDHPRRIEEMWSTNIKTLKTLCAGSFNPDNAESVFQSFQEMPEISSKLIEVGLDGAAHMLHQWGERIMALNPSSAETGSVKDLNEAFLQHWTQWYEKEGRRLLNIPQLGLTRFYQEDINMAADKYTRFQTSLAAFFHLLYRPVENALHELQEELGQIAQKESLPEDAKFYYDKWIKALEGRYMVLFQSAEYIQALSNTIEAMNEFVGSRRSVLEGALKTMPIPTHTDMDELYKEIYQLKRRIRGLEQQLAAVESRLKSTDIN
jgi:polyhydroxyalkanoate synthase subunit PhaE